MLEINLIDEFHIFLLAINYGLIIGVIYDFYRAFRYYSKPKRILSIIEDLLLWLIITLVFFMFLVKNTDGIIRGFVIVGFLIGSTFYVKVISRYNFPILIKIFKLILGLINEIMKLVLYPFRKLFNFLKQKMERIVVLPKAIFRDAKKYIKITSKKK